MKRHLLLLTLLLPCVCAIGQTLTVHADKPTVELGPYLYGVFFEDINYAGDGGLNSNLVQNNSFEYYGFFTTNSPEPVKFHPMYAWQQASEEGGEGQLMVSRSTPLNANNLNNLEILQTSEKGWFGVTNLGYDGMVVKEGEPYDFSCYVSVWKQRLPMQMPAAGPEGQGERRRPRGEGQAGPGGPGGQPGGQPGGGMGGDMPTNIDIAAMMRRMPVAPARIKVQLEDGEGNVLDSFLWDNDQLDREWRQLTCTLTPSASCSQARLTILVKGNNLTKLDMVSLRPQKTFNGHGLRPDLVQAVKDLGPGFMRFPGGCIVHGGDMENTYHWKETIGDPAQRKNIWSRWGYFQSMELGYYEYFVLCEDLGAIPLPVMPVGVSCGFEKYEVLPVDQLDGPIQEMLDLVEFANGGPETTWGAVRCSLGHPEPFGLQYLSLGNEEQDTPEFRERYPYFVKALREQYPDIRIIGTSGFGANIPLFDLMIDQKVWSTDEHYYMGPQWFLGQQHRFDGYDRTQPKIFVGEYASNGNKLENAVAEAAFMTGLERNADIVEMASYAPLFSKYGHSQWERADMIWFDNEQVVLTPNYYVQQLFSRNKGDVYLENEFSEGGDLAVSATLDREAGELIVKLVNPGVEEKAVRLEVAGARKVGAKGTLALLTGPSDATNTREHPDQVRPVTSTVKAGKKMTLKAPAGSVQVLRVPVK